MKKILIYSDGACSGNPGIGGWANAHKKSNGTKLANYGYTTERVTNNAMELKAALEAVKAVRHPRHIVIMTDSRYLITCWAHNEEWLMSEDRPNHDLWVEFIHAVKNGKHTVSFEKVRGHSGDEMNSLVDRLARQQIKEARHKLYEDS
jgi:ribonuclease HI